MKKYFKEVAQYYEADLRGLVIGTVIGLLIIISKTI
jgi:hypothetical protein